MPLTAESPRVLRNADAYLYVDNIVSSGVTIYPGALCMILSATGLVTNAADSTTGRFAGLAIGEGGDNKVVVGDGVKRVRLIIGQAEALLPCAATVDVVDLYTVMYCFDEASVTDVATLGPVAGIMTEVEVSGVSCWVAIRASAMPLGT